MKRSLWARWIRLCYLYPDNDTCNYSKVA